MPLQFHPQSIYYSLRTFVLGLRESAGRAVAEYSRSKQAAEAGIKAALEAAAGDMQSECSTQACMCTTAAWYCSVKLDRQGCCS